MTWTWTLYDEDLEIGRINYEEKQRYLKEVEMENERRKKEEKQRLLEMKRQEDNNRIDTYFKDVMTAVQMDKIPFFDVKWTEFILDKYMEIMTDESIHSYLPKGRYFIVGDIHGDFKSLAYILRFIDVFSWLIHDENIKIVFLGDYVDRGSNSFEVYMTLLLFKLKFPNKIILLRGNHEDRYVNRDYSSSLYTDKNLQSKWYESYNYLQICCTIGEELFCIHGGVPVKIKGFKKKIWNYLPFDIQNDEQVINALWNDPMDNDTYINGEYSQSNRGAGIYRYGQNAVDSFCKVMEVSCIVRAHEVLFTPFKVTPDGKVLTVFSSINYWKNFDRMQRNFAGMLYIDQVQQTLQPRFVPLRDFVDLSIFAGKNVSNYPPLDVLNAMLEEIDKIINRREIELEQSTVTTIQPTTDNQPDFVKDIDNGRDGDIIKMDEEIF